jgi:hypothetical protein
LECERRALRAEEARLMGEIREAARGTDAERMKQLLAQKRDLSRKFEAVGYDPALVLKELRLALADMQGTLGMWTDILDGTGAAKEKLDKRLESVG